MRYRTPLRVEESWVGYKLVDADGITIASAVAIPGFVPLEKQCDFVFSNFTALADAANAAPEKTE